MSTRPSLDRMRLAGALLAVAIVVALVALILFAQRGDPTAAGGAGAEPGVLRLQGSNTVGADLAPDLAEAFLTFRGAPDVRRESAGDVETVSGTLPGADEPTRIEVRSAGTETAFDGLASGDADVGMASRRITSQEVQELAALGDLTARESEHVLALDAVAVIVRPETGVTALSIEQLRGVFTCAVTDWGQLGGAPGPIRVLARDDNSGTYESFRDTVLAGQPLCPAAERFADSRELARAVTDDPRSIGFVGLPFVGSNRALEIYDGASTATGPTGLAVSTESYLLTRRLYLYLPVLPSVDPLARDFVEAFSLSEAGQRLVQDDQFISPLFPPAVPAAAPCVDAPPEYCASTGGAERIPFDVRFESGTDQLDNRAFRNLDLFAGSLTGAQAAGRQVLLVGFADNAGTDATNLELSRLRSATVQRYLAERGVAGALTLGFGEALPVDTNDTAEGREQNRRVEVWLR